MMTQTARNPDVVITGCGWVTPFTWGPFETVLAALSTSNVKTQAGTRFFPVPDTILDECGDLGPEIKKDKGAAIAAIALSHALASASLDKDHYPADRVGLVVGSALAGQLGMVQFANEVRAQSARFVSPIHFPQTVGNYLSGALARAWSIRGPNSTVASGNASGLEAVCEAVRLIGAGRADIIYAGGVDRLSPDLASGFADSSKPTSDGACMFVVEQGDRARERGVSLLARVGEFGTFTGAELMQRMQARHYDILAGSDPLDERTIAIERWTGACLGVWGAACLAAAISAASGLSVPVGKTGMMGNAESSNSAIQTADKSHAAALVFAKGDDDVYRAMEIQAGQ